MATESGWVGYSSITRLELFGYPGLTDDEESALITVLGELKEVDVSREVVDRAIQIRKQKAVKVPDAIIAASALTMKAVLITRNTDDFKHVDELTLLDPFSGRVK